MKDLQNLLNHVSIITKKNNEILDATGGRFNMFKLLGVNHYENTHSAILAEFLNPKGSHGLKSKFLQAFVDHVIHEESLKDFNYENAKVKTEAQTGDGRIDILIDDFNGHAIVIENKIYADDQCEQLKRYDVFANHNYEKSKYKVIYLTLMGSVASENSGGGIDYIQISYTDDIIKWLEQCVSIAARFPLVRETLYQYINHLKQLTKQDINMKNQEELVVILSRNDNIESALTISENIKEVKIKLLKDLARKVAEECDVEYIVPNTDVIGFFKKNWQENAGIWFGSSNGKTYYSLKTAECREGKAIPQQRIEVLFDMKVESHNPYGFGIVLNEHWATNNQLFIKMADGTLAKDTIIPRVQKVLDYLKEHPEIERKL